MRGDTCGTKLRNTSWLRERRSKEKDDGEKVEDCAHAGCSGDGPRGWLGLCTDEKRGLRFRQCSEHEAGGDARVRSGREVRRGAIPVVDSGTGGGRGKAGSAEVLCRLSQYAIHHHATAAARCNLGCRSQ